MHAWQAAGLASAEEWERHSLDIRIRLAAQPYLAGDWGYDEDNPAVLWSLPSAMRADKLVGRSRLTNCSTMTTSILTSVAPTKPWTLQEYGDLQVFADRLPATDSPVVAVVRMGLGAVADGFRSGEWYLVQGVRVAPEEDNHGTFRGHAFLVLVLDDGRLLILEATSRRGADGEQIGPRYRITTADDLRAEYPAALHLAQLFGP